jgi:hypothetical protein
MAKRIVRMVKRYGALNPGEVCGFDVFEATALVLRGFAQWNGPEHVDGSPTGPLPPLRKVVSGGVEQVLAPNIPEDAAYLRSRAKE